MFIGGVGFFSGGTGGGGGGGTTVTVKQYVVGAGGDNPVSQTSVFNLATPLPGSTLQLSVQGIGDLLYGTQFTYTVANSAITQIQLLGGLVFQQNEVYTAWGLS